jgi:hypothetical protein
MRAQGVSCLAVRGVAHLDLVHGITSCLVLLLEIVDGSVACGFHSWNLGSFLAFL